MNVETGARRNQTSREAVPPLDGRQTRQHDSQEQEQQFIHPPGSVEVAVGDDDGSFAGGDDASSLEEEQASTGADQWQAAGAACGLGLGDCVEYNDVSFEERLGGDHLETNMWEVNTGRNSMQFQLTAESMSPQEEQAARERRLAEDQRLQEAIESVESTDGYLHLHHWSWNMPPGSSLALPENVVQDKMIGVCMKVPSDSHLSRETVFTDPEVSMIRMIDYMDMRPKNSRKTLDGLMKILREETEDRGFNPKDCPSRHTVAEKVKKKYGMGQQPQVARLAVSSKNVAASLVEKAGAGESEVGEEQRQITWKIWKEAEMSDRYSVNIIAFSVRDGILDLLDDMDIFGEMCNLVVNRAPLSPFEPYQNQGEYSKDVLDGTWYSETLQYLKNLEPREKPFVPGLDFLLPLIMYVDKTGIDVNQRYPLEPLIYTLAIIKRSLRNYPRSWRLAGYIPDLENKSAAEMAQNRSKNPGATTQSYHLALGFVLRGIAQVQEEGIVTWLRLGPYQKRVRLRIEVAFVMGDGKSADMLTCRVPSHKPTRRISRCCHTLQADCDRVLHQCRYIQKDDIPAEGPIKADLETRFQAAGMTAREMQEKMPHLLPPKEDESDKEEEEKEKNEDALFDSLRKLILETLNNESFHPAPNAFVSTGIRFGGDKRSIWGANPIDLMHAFQSGLVMYIVKMGMEMLPPRNRVKLDKLVDRLFGKLRSHEKTNGYPRTNFSKGFSKVSLITSNEQMGKLFVLFLVLRTKMGGPLFKKYIFGEENVLDGVEAGGETFSEANIDKQIAALEKQAEELKEARLSKGQRKEQQGEECEEEAEEDEGDEDGNKKSKQSKESMHRKCSRADFIELAEALLAFHAWSRLDRYPVDADTKKIPTETYRRSIQKMLGMIRFYMPRENGMGWGIQKFHDILHLVDDMERFGPSQGFNCQCAECGLKYWAKLMASTSQMRGYNTFCEQCASRQFEYNCFAKARRQNRIRSSEDENFHAAIDRNRLEEAAARKGSNEDGEDEEMGESICGGKVCRVYHRAQTEVEGRNKRKSQFQVHPVIEDFMRGQDQLSEGNDRLPATPDKYGRPYWVLHTEATIVTPFLDTVTGEPQEPFLVRADPDYQKGGPWYDWIMVHFEEDDDAFQELNRSSLQYPPEVVPAKVLALARHPETGGLMALVHPCEFRFKKKDQIEDSVLTEVWHLHYSRVSQRYTEAMQVEHMVDLPHPQKKQKTTQPVMQQVMHRIPRERVRYRPQLVWVAAESIVGPCFVVEENPGIHEELVNGSAEDILEQSRVLLVLKHNQWADCFTTAL